MAGQPPLPPDAPGQFHPRGALLDARPGGHPGTGSLTCSGGGPETAARPSECFGILRHRRRRTRCGRYRSHPDGTRWCSRSRAPPSGSVPNSGRGRPYGRAHPLRHPVPRKSRSSWHEGALSGAAPIGVCDRLPPGGPLTSPASAEAALRTMSSAVVPMANVETQLRRCGSAHGGVLLVRPSEQRRAVHTVRGARRSRVTASRAAADSASGMASTTPVRESGQGPTVPTVRPVHMFDSSGAPL